LKIRRSAEGSATLVVLMLAAGNAAAQNDDVPLPPRIDQAPAAPERRPARPPERTRLAPLPEDRAAQDEIVVIGQTEFRLPDLGSAWRAEQEAEQRAAARIRVTLLPVYDPEAQAVANDLFLINRETHRRHGVIELFRVRFGRRGRE
jgi:hypothetical protein